MANSIDKKRKKMNVVVMDKEEADKDKSIVKSKDIICPECNQNIMMDINKFKINLFDCKNLHKVDNILLNEFEKTQMINLSYIICDICKTQNKSNAAAFFLCYTCNIKLCSTCKENHDNSHNIINYDKANYNCSKHNKPFTSYCKTCKIDLCKICEKKHANHKIIKYDDITPKIKERQRELKEIKRKIEDSKACINQILKIIDNAYDILDNYYKICNDILDKYDSYNSTLRNYHIIQNINFLEKSNKEIIKHLDYLIKEDDCKDTYFGKCGILIDIYYKERKNYAEENIIDDDIPQRKEVFQSESNNNIQTSSKEKKNGRSISNKPQ